MRDFISKKYIFSGVIYSGGFTLSFVDHSQYLRAERASDIQFIGASDTVVKENIICHFYKFI